MTTREDSANAARGPELRRHRRVDVSEGVISDADNDNAERYLMRVVRQTGATLALRFAGEIG